MESSEVKRRRGRSATEPTSPVPSTSRGVSMEELAKSQLQLQKDFRRLSKAVGKTSASKRAKRPREPPVLTSQDSTEILLGSSDSDYPRPGQSPVRRGTRSLAKSSARRKAKRKRSTSKPKGDTSSSTSSSVPDTDSSGSNSSESRKRRVVRRLMSKATPRSSSKRGKKNFIPSKFVRRGRKFEKVKQGEANWPEYLSALRAMAKAPECPSGWSRHLFDHEDHILLMARTWDWPTCRLWSETVFNMVHDGSLPERWNDTVALKEVQRDVISVGKRVSFTKEGTTVKPDVYKKPVASLPTTAFKVETPVRADGTDSQRVQFDRERDGKPCYPWNWGKDCGFEASHGSPPDAKPHICAYCAYRTRKVLHHREQDCINKQRAAQRAQTNARAQSGF